MMDRRDPMIAAARIVLAAQDGAERTTGARATVGKLIPNPGGSNVISLGVDFWLDVRHPDDTVLEELVSRIGYHVEDIAGDGGCTSQMTRESLSPLPRSMPN